MDEAVSQEWIQRIHAYFHDSL